MKSRRKSQGGNALVEFALSATLLASIFAGIFQFGYTMNVVSGLVSAVRSGARYASAADKDNANYQTAVKNMVVYNQTTSGTTPAVPGLSTANVEVVVDESVNPSVVTVRIINFEVNALFRSFHFNEKPSLTFVYNGPA